MKERSKEIGGVEAIEAVTAILREKEEELKNIANGGKAYEDTER